MKNSTAELNKVPIKKYPTIGACGLDCGLCPRFYTVGPSRCPGCAGPHFFQKHPSCSFITCCVKKLNHETCGECLKFPCSKFKSEEEYQQLKASSSYPSYKRNFPNLNFIKDHGIEKFIEQQKKRIQILEVLIKNFDDGRSRSYFCKIAALLDLTTLGNSLAKANLKITEEKIDQLDTKTRAKIFKAIINELTIIDQPRSSGLK